MIGYIVSLVIFTATYALFSLGLNLQWGFTGLINFGHIAFMTLGAYTTVLLSLQDVPLFISVIVGGAMAALLGLLIGFSTLRLREDYLAIVTVGVAEVVRLIAVNEAWLTRGPMGLYGFPLPLEDYQPNLVGKLAAIAILTAIVAVALWRLWRWMGAQIQGSSRSQWQRNLPLVATYLISLMAILFAIGAIAKQLKANQILPPWGLGIFLIATLAATVWLYVWWARRMFPKLPEWHVSSALIGSVGVTAFGLWVYGCGAVALYNYSYKAGLMLLLLVVLTLTFWFLERMLASPWGRILKAIREDEEVARALGKNVFWYKLQSFMLGGAIAGIAGAFYAWQLTFINPDGFTTLITFQAWTIVILGGAGNNVGTLLGATIFWAYNTATRFILKDIIPLDDARLGAFRLMVIGLLLIILIIWRPQGILGKKEELTLGG
jgi:neutral amino acid transport system permease protein